jgi:hypothetical protein
LGRFSRQIEDERLAAVGARCPPRQYDLWFPGDGSTAAGTQAMGSLAGAQLDLAAYDVHVAVATR